MGAGKFNFTIEQGATYERSFTWKNSAGVPIDLTGYTIRLMAKNTVDETTPLITLSTVSPPGGITVTDPATGTWTISLSPATTAAYKFDKIVYDLEVQSLGGVVKRLLEGIITLSKEVTK